MKEWEFDPSEAQRELLRLLEARRIEQQPVMFLKLKGFPYNSCSGVVAAIYREAMKRNKS